MAIARVTTGRLTKPPEWAAFLEDLQRYASEALGTFSNVPAEDSLVEVREAHDNHWRRHVDLVVEVAWSSSTLRERQDCQNRIVVLGIHEYLLQHGLEWSVRICYPYPTVSEPLAYEPGPDDLLGGTWGGEHPALEAVHNDARPEAAHTPVLDEQDRFNAQILRYTADSGHRHPEG